MLTLTRHRAPAVLALAIFVTALAAFGVRPAQATTDPTNPTGSGSDTENPVPAGAVTDPVGEAPPVDPGMSAAEIAAANEAAMAELAPGIVMSGTPVSPPPLAADSALVVDDNQAGLTPDVAPAADGAPAPTGLVLNEPYPGSSSTITFADSGAPLADAAPLPPYLALERDTAARSRVVSIDVPSLQAALSAETVSVSLFDDVSVDLDSTFAPSPGQMGSAMWGASGADDPASDAITDAPGGDAAVVSIVDGDIIGQWWVDGTQYGMQPLPNGDHLIFEVARDFPDDPDVLPPGPDNGPRVGSEADGADIPEADPIAAPTIDVMIAYDAEAFAFYGSNTQTVRNNAIAMVNLSNVVYINSDPGGSLQNMTLTNVYATGVTPNTNSTATYRNQLANKTDGNFDAIHTVRDQNYADLVVLLSNRFANVDGLCGISFFPTSANPSENDAYNVTEASCALGGLTFTHELGHNQCAGHDITGGSCSGTYPNDKGFTDCTAGRRTIMSRNSNSCATRQPVFSNPGNTFGGWTTGSATTDNQAVLEDEDAAPGTVSGGLANYRAFPGGQAAVAGTDGVTCAFRTIEDAILNVAPGSTIFIAPGTYPAVTANINYNISKDLTLAQGTATCGPTAGGSATAVALQPNAGGTSDAVLEVTGSADVTLDRITIENGNSTEGTVQVFTGAVLTLDGSIVRNGVNPAGDGGGVRVLAGGALTTSGNYQIENNSAVNGGGIWVEGGAVVLASLGDVDHNTASGNGGGIYAINGALVSVASDADVLDNTGVLGGGIYADDATVYVAGSGTYIGLSGNANTATSGGGGIFATNNSSAIIEGGGKVAGNTADFAGGVRVAGGSTLTVNSGGAIEDNEATGIGGGGVYGSNPSTIDLNPGAAVSNNTSSGFGGGLVSFATIDADGGTGASVQQVQITGNAAATEGGGVYSNGTIDLDTVAVSSNAAATGAGAHVAGGTFTVAETGSCDLGDLGFDRYCNEFRDNTATGTGGALSVTGGVASITKTGFAGNHANQAAVLVVSGSASAGLGSVVAFQNTETATGGDGLVTAKGTSTLYLLAVTFADQTEAFLDSDNSPTVVTNRVLTTTPSLALVAAPLGQCNMGPAGAGLPGQIVAAPLFATDPSYLATHKSAYLLETNSVGRDACAQLGAPPADARDTGELNGKGAANPGLDWDIGGLEAAAK